DILLDTMFELPGLENVEEVVVNEEAANTDAKPLIIYGEETGKKEGASA
ncbi:MAG TPA: ATP-dependent Clp protease ATP-binding subunit ClpX, partial [Maritimibacter sp.]|nr:ATP-dependent Clp protease ATP-binding subunit ClpX [Maritimibacter sp.]